VLFRSRRYGGVLIPDSGTKATSFYHRKDYYFVSNSKQTKLKYGES